MAGAYLRSIQTFDSITPLELETRGPGTYLKEFLIEGNSILSTIFVESCDPGATLNCSYFDATTGSQVGEEYPLAAHREMDAFGNDRILVTKIHNKPRLRAVVSGGNVRFSVYITVVSSTASELDTSLRFEGDTVNLLRDKGLPIAAKDIDSGLWSFLPLSDGKLAVSVPSGIAITPVIANKRFYNQSLNLSYGDGEVTHINYTVPSGKQFQWLSGNGTADSWVQWVVEINGVRYSSRRNAFDSPNVDLHPGAAIILTAGETLVVKVKCGSSYVTLADIETFIFGKEGGA